MALKPEVNLYLEDDYLITPDTLTMVDQWAASNCEGVLALRRPDNTQDASQPSVVAEYRTGLYGCGFAWRAADWPIIRRQWFAPGPMWDIAMEGLPLRQWRPLVNRSYGIGIVGTHTHGNNADKNLFGPAYDGPPVSQFHFRA